tara:strand:+ start:726 stop:908 length:183 start_codon:yes stop_codon:yes gene_type:complete
MEEWEKYDVDQITKIAKDYADKEVLRELKNMKKVLAKKSFSEHCIEELDKRIKELTEEID